MIRLILLSLISFSAFANEADDIYLKLKFDEFTERVNLVKKELPKDGSIDFQIKELLSNKGFWLLFNSNEFKREYLSQLDSVFKEKELQEISTALNNPFLVKFLRSITIKKNYFDFLVAMHLRPQKIGIPKSEILMNVMNLMDLKFQGEDLAGIMGTALTRIDYLFEFYKNGVQSERLKPNVLELNKENSKKIVVYMTYQSLLKISKTELQEVLRLSKKSPILKKFIALTYNFNYLFFRTLFKNQQLESLKKYKRLSL